MISHIANTQPQLSSRESRENTDFQFESGFSAQKSTSRGHSLGVHLRNRPKEKMSKKYLCCGSCFKGKENKRRFDNIETGEIKNRFAGLTKQAKSEAIRNVFRRAIRKCLVKTAFLNAKSLYRFNNYRNESTAVEKKNICLIMPGTTFNFIWTIVVLLLLLYTAIVTPFVVVFIDNPPLPLFIWELIIDGLFMIDIIINFFTPYYDEGILIKDKWKIAKNYLKSWFLIDLIACIPFNLFSSGENTK